MRMCDHDVMTGTPQDAGLAHQTELYGAPLGDSVRQVTATLGISQAAVARTLGVSAPMLSQLVSGQRVKLGNPQAVQRLQALLGLVDEVRAGLAHHEVGGRLEAIRDQGPTTLTRTRSAAPGDADGPVDVVPQLVSRLLRAVASGRELAGAAEVLDREGYAELATLLRAYGGDDPSAAARHYDGVRALLSPGSPST